MLESSRSVRDSIKAANHAAFSFAGSQLLKHGIVFGKMQTVRHLF